MQTTRDMRWPENIENVEIEDKTYSEIFKFYNNVGKKFINTYSREDINKLIKNNFLPITKLDKTRLVSDPILDKWKGFGRVVIGKWNFAIDIKGNKVTVVDACHQQNMTNIHTIADLFETDLNTPSPRITDITFPPSRDNRHFIRCQIDGEQQFMREIPLKYLNLYKAGELTKYQLAEKCYAKELDENRLTLDLFINGGRKF